ncbi:MAG: START domain-containing protein [Pseudomonadales bacterium]
MTRAQVGLIAAILVSGNMAAAEDWQLDRHEDGIKVYTRKIEDLKHREFKGVVELETSMASAVGLLDDTEACQDWLHMCQESRVLEQKNFSERYIYQVTDLPFPASTRDAVFRAVISQSTSRDIRIDLTSRPEFIPETRYVRIHDSYGSYLLEKLEDNGIRLTWTMYVDPAGSLPAFLVNRLLTDTPFESLRNFREVVQRDKYQMLMFEYDEHNKAVDLKNRSW